MYSVCDLSQRYTVPHRESPFTDHFPGICTQNGYSENVAAAIGKGFDESVYVAIGRCPVDLVKWQPIDREACISVSQRSFRFSQARELRFREGAPYYVPHVKRSRKAKNGIHDRHLA